MRSSLWPQSNDIHMLIGHWDHIHGATYGVLTPIKLPHVRKITYSTTACIACNQNNPSSFTQTRQLFPLALVKHQKVYLCRSLCRAYARALAYLTDPWPISLHTLTVGADIRTLRSLVLSLFRSWNSSYSTLASPTQVPEEFGLHCPSAPTFPSCAIRLVDRLCRDFGIRLHFSAL